MMKHVALACISWTCVCLACVPFLQGTGTIGAAWPAAQSGCSSDARCADGLVCEPLTDEMLAAYLASAGLDELPAGVPHLVGESVCQPGCRIDDAFRSPADADPESGGCRICDPSVSTTTWTLAAVDTACDDGQFCTSNGGVPGDADVCDETGACIGQPVDCNDGLYCTGVESCNEDADRCDSTGDPCPSTDCHACQESTESCFAPAGSGCGSSRDTVCDNPDTCDGAGRCLTNHESSETVCRLAVSQCDLEETCDGRGRCREDRLKQEGAVCDDGLICTSAGGLPGEFDTCDGFGACTGDPVVCDDGNPCTDDVCDPGLGCLVTNNVAPCDDGDSCTTGDICNGSGVCTGDLVVCDDGNPCTDDVCDPGLGCLVTNNVAPCDDGNPCTADDVCLDGGCVGGPPPAELCDGMDADCDGLVDCYDADCAAEPACVVPTIVFDPVQPRCSYDGQVCSAQVVVPFQAIGGTPPGSLTFEVSFDAGADGSVDDVLVVGDVLGGTAPDYVVTATFPIGSHALLIDVQDGSGNTDSATIPFAVVDCKAPSPICINGLAIELMPVEPGTDADGDGDVDAGAMTVSAIDFIASAITDCSEPIRYSINHVGEKPNIDRSSLVMTCDDQPTTIVEVHGWDTAGNHDFCETYVIVQDNLFNLCTP